MIYFHIIDGINPLVMYILLVTFLVIFLNSMELYEGLGPSIILSVMVSDISCHLFSTL
jgi:hypothetical protein